MGGPDGFVNGIRQLTAHLGVPWLLVPIALLVGLNSIGGAAANFTSNSRLPFVVGIHRYLPAAFGTIHARYRTPWVSIVVLEFWESQSPFSARPAPPSVELTTCWSA